MHLFTQVQIAFCFQCNFLTVFEIFRGIIKLQTYNVIVYSRNSLCEANFKIEWRRGGSVVDCLLLVLGVFWLDPSSCFVVDKHPSTCFLEVLQFSLTFYIPPIHSSFIRPVPKLPEGL